MATWPSCWFHGSSFKGFSIVFLFSDWPKSNHFRVRMERGFLDVVLRQICSAVAETIQVTNYATSFGSMFRKPSSTLLKLMILDLWNQQRAV